MIEIQLTRNKTALIDDSDYEVISKYKWSCHATGYACTTTREKGKPKRTIKMHMLIVGEKDGYECDHINGDRLDNRKENLRHVTRSQNMMNRRKIKNKSSIYKGVSYRKTIGKWTSNIRKDKTLYNIGLYTSEIEAAIAYNKKALELFGEFARINII